MSIKKTIATVVAAVSIITAGTVAPITDRLVSFVQGFEGYSSVPYADPASPKDETLLTVCSGMTNKSIPGFVIKGKTYTKEECNAAEEKVLKQFSEEIAPLIKVDITQAQYESLIDFSYNLGVNNLKKSTLLKKINANDCFGASAEFSKWAKAAGKTMKGLVRRRAVEAELFRKWCLPNGKFPTKGLEYGN